MAGMSCKWQEIPAIFSHANKYAELYKRLFVKPNAD